MIMKNMFFAMLAFMASVSAFAQVDSTSVSPADSTAAGSSVDSSAVSSDTSKVGSTGDVEITDDDLRKYAEVMDSVETMKQELLSQISAKIKSNGKMKISRYNQLSKAIDDKAKLAELKATQEEITFVNEVSALKSEGAAKISAKVESLANEYVGTEKYNKIKNSLGLDTNMRTRYDKIVSEMQSDDSASSKTSH
jgi:hypothetical protein